MNGAEALLHTLEASGVGVCFANPGTSEMQLVSAIGKSHGMRPVLCLFEGVVSGAADGYGRMSERPAATLLHVGSGFSNSMANLHNARQANTSIVNIVGDHATYHLQYDTPLKSDVGAHAEICSSWVKVAQSPDDLSAAGAEAVQASMQGAGAIATLIVPADHAWNAANVVASPALLPKPGIVPEAEILEAVNTLANSKPTALILGGRALREENLALAGRIADSSGATLLVETFPARFQRGAGRVPATRIPYFAEAAAEVLDQFEQIILIGAKPPVSFFAYPAKESWLAPSHCTVKELANPHHDIHNVLSSLVAILDAPDKPRVTTERIEPSTAIGPLTSAAIGQTISALLPAGAIVSDEGATCGLAVYATTENAAPHDWLTLTGGAIGQGLPLSLGAAIACPDRKVVALQADGSAMYTIQALWSMAREKADVTIIILNNRSYAILNIELARVGADEPNAKTLSMLELSNPDLNFIDIAKGMGVPASAATTAEQFHDQFSLAMTTPGPRLIEAILA